MNLAEYLLPLMILTPLVAAAVVVAMPASRAKFWATVGTLVPVGLFVFACFVFSWDVSEKFWLQASLPWLPGLGLSLSVGVDSVAMLLIGLTVLLGPICVIGSFSAVTDKVKTYYVWLLILQAAMTGVFASRDLILFYICFEFTLIPMYVLIALYGSTNRAKAATKFFLYTFTGSVIALAGLLYVVWFNTTLSPTPTMELAGQWTFSLDALMAAARTMSTHEQAWVLLALLAGFAVKVPLFPLHTWLPLAHTEAPTAGSVILAGVLLKLGTYGIYRFGLGFCPAAMVEYAPLIAAVSIVGIVYAGLICWVQTDVKKLVAYSSVSHLGFCILGLAAINVAGLSGSVLYMVSHGLSTGALFLCIGMVYERYHTRSMNELGGLAAKMPVWATFMVFFTMASVGLPGLNGFVSEFLCLLGAVQSWGDWGTLPGASGVTLGPWYAFVAGTGMIVAAIYLLFMVGKVVFGPLVEPAGHDSHGGGHEAGHGHSLPTDLSAREIGVLLPLAAACLITGVYPRPLLDAIGPGVSEISRAAQAYREQSVVASDDPAGSRIAREGDATREGSP